MDVTCERCRTVYEFDDTLVSPRGTTVKCTSCGHLFKVHRPGATPTADEIRPWLVRHRDGSVEPLASIGELTELIARGKMVRDDEISRAGHGWKRLGDIAELEPFFAKLSALRDDVSREERQSTPAFGLAPRASASTVEDGLSASSNRTDVAGAKTTARLRVASPSPGSPSRETLVIAGSTSAAREMPATRRPATTLVGTGSAGQPAPPGQSLVPAPVPPSPPPSSQAEQRVEARRTTSFGRTGDALPPPGKHRRSRLSWIIAAAIMVVTTLGLVRGREARWLDPTEPPSQMYMSRADAAVEAHRIDAFENAVTEYTKALAFDETNPQVLVALSRVHALWSQVLIFQRLDLRTRTRDAEGSDASSYANHAAAIEQQAAHHARQAQRYIEEALRRSPGHADTEIAAADAYRLVRDLPRARSHLNRARTLGDATAAEPVRVAALLHIDEAGGAAASARALVTQARGDDPAPLRLLLLQARVLLEAAEEDEAVARLDEVLARDAEHPEALRLKAILQAGHFAQADAANSVAAVAPSPSSSKSTEAAAAERPSTQDAEPLVPKEPRDPEAQARLYVALVKRGEAALERGALVEAREQFTRALSIRQQGAEARTGLGYLSLEYGRPAASINLFRRAAEAGHAEAYIGLGEAYRRMARKEDALRAYESYLAQAPDGRSASVARLQSERLKEELTPLAPLDVAPRRVVPTGPKPHTHADGAPHVAPRTH